MTRISVEQAAALLADGAAYLDVRTEAEFAAGHAPGAFNIPLKLDGPVGLVENPDFVDAVTRHFPADAKLVVGCRSGVRSAQACALLEARGYVALHDLAPGFAGSRDPFGRPLPGWETSGQPVEHEVASERSWAALARR
jgi:rhodanese-related sulfurtransferase